MERIESKYIRDEYQWDLVSEVKWDILQQNFESTNNILNFPDDFPKANFAAVECANAELYNFLASHGKF